MARLAALRVRRAAESQARAAAGAMWAAGAAQLRGDSRFVRTARRAQRQDRGSAVSPEHALFLSLCVLIGVAAWITLR
jgi:hypothetical protein